MWGGGGGGGQGKGEGGGRGRGRKKKEEKRKRKLKLALYEKFKAFGYAGPSIKGTQLSLNRKCRRLVHGWRGRKKKGEKKEDMAGLGSAGSKRENRS